MPTLDEPVHLSEYRGAWPVAFAAEQLRLVEALGIQPESLQHIGSTAVPGLVAKPIVDLMWGAVVYPPSEAVCRLVGALGYEALGEAGVEGRLYFRLREPQFSANLQVVERGGAHWAHAIALRDYLRAVPAARARYAQAKRAAVASGAQTLLGYSAAKAAVVGGLLQESLVHQNGSYPFADRTPPAAMPRFVAFLRGVMPTNAKMSDLKAAFESASFTGVKTVLGSGNVVFDTALQVESDIERAAEAAMTRSMGRSFYTIVRPAAYLQALVASDPYAAFGIPAGAKRVVSFMRAAQSPRVPLPLAEHRASVFSTSGREVFTAYEPTDKGPVFMALIERAFGANLTTRTLETVVKCTAA